MGAAKFELRTVCVPGRSEMHQCCGTTAKGKQCKTSGLYNCPKCDAFLCSWHVIWVKKNGVWRGAHCKWCRDEKGEPVKMEGRSQGNWLLRVGRGWFQLKEGWDEAVAKADAEASTKEQIADETKAFLEQD